MTVRLPDDEGSGLGPEQCRVSEGAILDAHEVGLLPGSIR
jgi:hypothetical protein